MRFVGAFKDQPNQVIFKNPPLHINQGRSP